MTAPFVTVPLLPCPFCGGAAEEYPDGAEEGWSVTAVHEEWCPSYAWSYPTQEDANAAWNHRATPQPPSAGGWRPISEAPILERCEDCAPPPSADVSLPWRAVAEAIRKSRGMDGPVVQGEILRYLKILLPESIRPDFLKIAGGSGK